MAEDHFQEIMETEPKPEVTPEEKPAPSVAGEAVPAVVEQKLTDIMEEDSPKPVEPEKVIGETEEPAPETESNTPQEMFDAQGLIKQYPGGLQELIESQANTNKYITGLEAERNALRDTATPKAPELPSEQDFIDDPINSTNKLMDSRLSAINQRLDNSEMANFTNSKPDITDMVPHMEQALRENPGIGQLSKVDAMKALYDIAKGKQITRASADASKGIVTPPPPVKANAETSVGKKSAPVVKDQEYYLNMTPAEREKELGVIPRYKD